MKPHAASPPVLLEVAAGAFAVVRAALTGRGAPCEPCGYLLGRPAAGAPRVLQAVGGENVHPRPRGAFLLAPEEQVAVRRAARAAGLEVVGFWHGHPHGPPRPSRADLAGLDGLSAPWMLIAGREESGGGIVVRGYRVVGDRAVEVRLTSPARPRPPPR